MSEQHTPGPWKFGHLGTEAFWIGPDYDQMPVARVDHDTEDARDNSRANAALVAASPDLLEALETLLTRVQLEMRTGRLPIDWADPVIEKARAAIAKAKGESK